MEFILLWFGFSIVVGVANKRDRSGAGWFFLALFISPLLAGLLVLALGESRPANQYQVVEVEPRSKTFGPILEKSVQTAPRW